MSSEKWSSSVSLTKFFSRITRTLSFSLKKNKKTIQPVIKNILFVPKSVPVIRRHPTFYNNDIIQRNRSRQGVHVNMYDANEDEDDCSRYSLQPNLSLFNISMENIHNHSEEQIPQRDWLDDILHSTKIDLY